MSKVPTPSRTPRKIPSSSGLRVPSATRSTGSGLVPPSSPRDRAPPSPRLTTRIATGTSSGTNSASASKPAPGRVPARGGVPPSPRRIVKQPTQAAPRVVEDSLDSNSKAPSKTVNIREAIALKRAEAKKAAANAKHGQAEDAIWSEGAGVAVGSPAEEEDILGRESVPQTIERAKRNGNLNLNSRSLTCLPRFLFESHLGITPDPLNLVPNSNDTSPQDQQVKSTIPSWEAQDLSSLKAADNAILELHHEVSLFGGIKHLDLHLNKIQSLPNSLLDLVNLMYLDLSRNELTSLPPNLACLPHLRTLNLSDNKLSALDLTLLNSHDDDKNRNHGSGSFFAPSVTRASEAFPKLQQLDVSRNALVAESITYKELPRALETLDLSSNQLGHAQHLFNDLSKLPNLMTLDMGKSHLADDLFSIMTQSDGDRFTKLRTLKLLDSKIPEEVVRQALPGRTLVFDVVRTNKPPGTNDLEVILNPPVIKEAWELEAEKRLRPSVSRANMRAAAQQSAEPVPVSSPPVVKEGWEIDAEQGLLTEGAKRRMRAAKQAEQKEKKIVVERQKSLQKPAEKEQWELDAEQGLLTEGAKRRARALAAARSSKNPNTTATAEQTDAPTPTPTLSPSPTSSSTSIHSIASYYDESRNALQLPSALPRPKAHTRAISLAPKLATDSGSNPLLPEATMPLAMIATQSFAHTLRVLTLSNRRVNTVFDLPSTYQSTSPLPVLDELNLVSCGLSNTVPISVEGTPGQSTALLPLISDLFPALSTLDLSQNALSNIDSIHTLLMPDWDKRRKGLKVFKAQGNSIENLDGIIAVCGGWKNDGKVDGWRLEEMDLRDNAIQKLPAELGLLPLDVLLVEGNLFRVPARRVWEREGSKGLLLWLRQRLEV